MIDDVDLVGVEIITEVEQLRRAEAFIDPRNRLSVAEVAAALNVSREGTHQLRTPRTRVVGSQIPCHTAAPLAAASSVVSTLVIGLPSHEGVIFSSQH